MVERRTLVGVIAAVLVAVLLLGAVGVGYLLYDFTRPVPESYTHVYDYEVTIGTDATLENVTIYLPVPALDGDSPIGAAVVAGSDGLVEAPADWKYRLVDTEHGTMLAVSTATLPPRYERRPMPRPLPPGAESPTPGGTPTPTPRRVLDAYRIDVELGANDTIDTRAPVGTEPTLVPRNDAVEAECTTPVTEGAVCRRFSTRAYLAYDAPDDATVRVFVRYSGTNSWFAGGWTGNSFDQTVSFEATGPRDGWLVVAAHEQVGVGNYPVGRKG